MSASQDSLDQFIGITGADTETATFYLESSKGDVNTALAAYLEAESGSMPGAYHSEPVPDTTRKGKSKVPQRGGIGTLGGLQQDEDDDDEDKPAEFYTGGEKSGLGVIDPSKKKKGDKADNLIQEILRKAAAGQPADDDEPTTNAFKGSGYTLGGEDEESKKVTDPNETFRRAMATRPPKVTRVLKLWKTGFSVDDGVLYRYDDPANKEYLEAINNGRAPLSLLNVQYGQAVDVNVEKRVDEEYTPPPKVYKPFEGEGRRLGTTPTGASPQPSRPTTNDYKIDIDESKPTTVVQVRLAAGGRVSGTFNTTHSLRDLYAFVRASSGSSSFSLLTPFPRREFEDSDTTLEEAGLIKGMVQQKLT